jgi:hypothetical protein
MNVKISYTVPFDEIPAHLRLVLADASLKLNELGGLLGHVGKEMMSDPLAVRRLDDIRKGLASVDFLLQDCYSIHTGYVAQKMQANPRDDTEEEQDVPLS